jgi:hypothetical protein
MPSPRYLLCAAALLGAGMFAGSEVARPSIAWGEIVTTPQQQHVLSGGQLSLPILQDISATLKDIDGRLSRIENMAKQMASKRTN